MSGWSVRDVPPQVWPLSVISAGQTPMSSLFSTQPTDGTFVAVTGNVTNNSISILP